MSPLVLWSAGPLLLLLGVALLSLLLGLDGHFREEPVWYTGAG